MSIHSLENKSARVSAFADDALARHDAVTLAGLVAKKQLQPRDLIAAAIARAEKVNDKLNAIAAPAFDLATSKTNAQVTGLLAGVPTFIKDTEEVEGLPLYMGSQALPGENSSHSSDIVQQVNATGLVTIGTSTTPEFGLKGTTESVRFGATRNPWHTDFSTGGSSGGSSALVAAGVVPIAHANDGAGSIRIPAACCGLVGLKPSQGRLAGKQVPGYLPANIFHEGVVTRSVRDTAAFYFATEQSGKPCGLKPIGNVQNPGEQRLKIALLTQSCTGVSCDSQNLAAVHQVARLCEQLGHQVELIDNPFYAGFDEDFWILWAHLAFAVRYMGKSMVSNNFNHKKLQDWAKYLVRYQWRQLHKTPGAFLRLKKFAQQYHQFMLNYDMLLTPTLGTPTQKIGYFGPEVDGDVHFERIKPLVPFTKYQNISGAPAISLPLASSSNGLPLGVQFAANFGEEAKLLALAFELEQAAPWKTLADHR